MKATVIDQLSGGTGAMDDEILGGAVGEAHGLLVLKDYKVKGWGYNRQMQCIGEKSNDTFIKPPKLVESLEYTEYNCLSVACGGAQSYAIMQPRR